MRKNLWDGWNVTNKIGEGRFGEVYRAVKTVDGGNLTCAIKYVSLPKNQEELNDLVKKGIVKNVNDANKYYLSIIDDLKKEIDIMKRFKDNSNIIKFYDYIQESKFDGSGVDFYIRMEFADDIDKYFSNRKPTSNDIVQLGIDICSALEACHSLNIIHKDIKPANIFIGSDGKYKLSDFGIASSIDNKDNQFVGTYNYLSPEVYNKQAVSYSTDLYSLGLVMYKLLNNNKLPFATRFSSDKDILTARMSGIDVFPIKGVEKELMDVIIKACSFNPNNRYKTAKMMREALEKVSGNIVVVPKENSITEKTISIYEAENIMSSNDDKTNVVANKINLFKQKLNNVKSSSYGDVPKKQSNDNSNSGGIDFKTKRKILRVVALVMLVAFILFLLNSCASSKKCNAGYVNKNGKCVSGYYYCDGGYVLNEDDKCQKVTKSIDAKSSYQCDDGYILNGEKCIRNDTKEPKSGYQCTDGFTLNGNKCVREEQVPPSVSYSCPDGYIVAGTTCAKVTVGESKISSYNCSKGTLSGNKCIYKEGDSSYLQTTKSCPAGKELDDTKTKCCYKNPYGNFWPGSSNTSWNCSEAIVNKSCSKGTLSGNTCMVDKIMDASPVYSCSSGFEMVMGQCIKTEEKEPTIKLSCANGLKLKNKMCVASVSVDALPNFTCDEGYIFTGTECVADDMKDAVKKYTCSKKYTLNGSKCEQYKIIRARVHYND